MMMRLFQYALPHFGKAYEINSNDLSFLLDMDPCFLNTCDHLRAISKCISKHSIKIKNIIVLRG
jgi:hypothetical protein